MEYITDWAGRIAAYLVFATVISNLLQKKSYLKYVQFITGIILILIVAKPLLSILSQEENYSFHLNRYLIAEEAADYSFIYEMQSAQEKLTLQKLENQLIERIKFVAENNELEVVSADICFMADSTAYTKPDKIQLVLASTDSNAELFGTDMPAVIRVRETLAEEFGLKKEEIKIEVVSG